MTAAPERTAVGRVMTCSTSGSPATGRVDSGTEPIAATHGRRLAELVGRTLHHVWLVWDLRADEWFSDCPVVLDFGDERVEIIHQKFDDLSITFNSIDPRQPVTWPTSDDFQLAWRAERSSGSKSSAGKGCTRRNSSNTPAEPWPTAASPSVSPSRQRT